MLKTFLYETLKFFGLLNFVYRLRYKFTQTQVYEINYKILDDTNYINQIKHSILHQEISENWLKKLNKLKFDLCKDGLQNFLRHPVILDTMFVRDNSFTKIQYDYLIKKNIDKKLIYENNIGSPLLSKIYNKSSANLIHHATHFESFLDYFNSLNEINEIFEFGGGYGSMARYILNKKNNIKYHFFDLEVFNILQNYYISSIYPDNNHNFFSKVNELDNINVVKNSLFISTWALSESPFELRKKFENFVLKYDFILIAFQKKVDGYDNLKYFSELFSKKLYNVNMREINYFKNNYYLFAKKKC